jgi:hypothetical protein
MKIVSGGQTGVDRAALDTAMRLGLEVGGWCPEGRWAEDGPIDARYPLAETPSPEPAERTEWNVRDSDATLVLLAPGHPPGAGTELTVALAEEYQRPCLVAALGAIPVAEVLGWLLRTRPARLNIAGPRESVAPGVYGRAADFLAELLGSVASQDAIR